ncbi:MAG: bifunctional diguanylate cyclase/phosphodiesterase [Ghiorsea sp.]
MINITGILKRKADKSAIYGGTIGVLAVIIATLLSAYFSLGNLSADTIMESQTSNVALWMLDTMPFLFMFWGQYIGSLIADEADSMMNQQASEIRSQAEETHAQLKHDNQHDPLTKLPNTGQFLQHIDKLVLANAHADDPSSFIQTLSGFITPDRYAPSGISVLLIDLDNFKEINNTLGAQNGDAILKEIGARLQQEFNSKKVFVARLSGDNFALAIAHSNESIALKIVHKIHMIFKKPFMVNGVSLILETSIGISLYPQHGNIAKELQQHAEVAMYSCKNSSVHHAFYDPSNKTNDLNDLLLKAEIDRAFDNDELCLFYQPKLNRQNQILETEALVRWQHPSKGLIPPDTFIPMIIQKRLHGELFQKILDISLTQVKKWHEVGIHIRIALNLTASDLLDPTLPAMVANKLSQYDLTTGVLKFEITETTLIENQELTMDTLLQLEKMGVPISIDDFGTGYSSLSYLSTLPINELKIDRSFVVAMAKSQRDVKIIQAIIALAHSLELSTVAEGVEDAETMVQLRKLNCDVIQGYYISKPMDGESFTTWLLAWNKKQASKRKKT